MIVKVFCTQELSHLHLSNPASIPASLPQKWGRFAGSCVNWVLDVWWSAPSCPQPSSVQQLALVLRWSRLGDNSIVKLRTGLSEPGLSSRVFHEEPESVAGCLGCWLQQLQDASHRLRKGSWEHQGCRADLHWPCHADGLQETWDVLLWMQQEVCGKMKDAEF